MNDWVFEAIGEGEDAFPIPAEPAVDLTNIDDKKPKHYSMKCLGGHFKTEQKPVQFPAYGTAKPQ